MSKSSESRYAVISAKTSKVVKNAATRESAREWKRSQNTPSNYRIFDRDSNSVVS